ncbi:MAG: hypothetical protein EAY75_13725 [Bacteroidetes bacterium]|nr:MAG: hypothetical protein EAY75_13725 [Bacteroidota bacterium]
MTNHRTAAWPLLTIIAVTLLAGCLKDTKSHTYRYTISRPVFKTSESVRSAIKNDQPQAVKNPGKMYLLGHYIFLNEVNEGIHVINNANPAAPINEAFVHIPGCLDLAARGNALYADCYTDLMTLDISNPKAIGLKNWLPGVFPERQYIDGYKIDSGTVIAEWITKDTVVTEKWELNKWRKLAFENVFISNFNSVTSSAGGNTKNVGSSGKGGSTARFAIQNNHLYTVSHTSLQALSIALPFAPQWQSSTTLPFGVETIYPFKDKLFIGSNTGMYIFDASTPARPKQTGTFTHARVCDPVIADDNFAYVTLRGGNFCAGNTNQLDVVNVINVFAPSLLKSYPLKNPRGLDKDGRWLFICDGTDGLKVFDAENPQALVPLRTIAMSETFDVICFNKIALVQAKDGFYQYDFADINNIKLVSKIGLQ